MQPILRIVTDEWELVIRSKDILSPRKRLVCAMEKRGLAAPVTSLGFSPAIKICLFEVEGEALEAPVVPCDRLQLPAPLFFENTAYDFEFAFGDQFLAGKHGIPELAHKLSRINEAFHFSARGKMLRGGVHTGNDIGWFMLPVRLEENSFSVSFEILPTKMDLAGDLAAMYRTIDAEYPFLRFSLCSQTEQQSSKGEPTRNEFPLLWLAHFKALNTGLVQALRQIVNAPHSRLLPEQRHLRADRLKGRIPESLAAKLQDDRKNGRTDRRYHQEYRRLDIDTPENRFIRMVVIQIQKKLGKFIAQAEKSNAGKNGSTLSKNFFLQLHAWLSPVERLSRNPFFREIGDYRELQGESLVLQQKSGYATVYRTWQQLKLYLDFLGNHTSVGMKNIAGLYEIWCFLEIRRILHKLGFEEKLRAPLPLDRSGIEIITGEMDSAPPGRNRPKDAMAMSYRLERADGLIIRLAHEPRFQETTAPVRSWLNLHKPDIALEVTFPGGEQFIWLFDAKYRIDTSGTATSKDMVPEDAINQMHRYRDALILQGAPDPQAHRSRPTFGAFALYPGFFDQENESNPYQYAIEAIGVGAFALLPSEQQKNGSLWLENFLTDRLGYRKDPVYHPVSPERFFIEEPSRIPSSGMLQIRHPDLALIIPVADESPDRDPTYYQGFHNGSARWYHTPVRTISEKYDNQLMADIRFCALAIPDANYRIIRHIWPVMSCNRVRRDKLTEEQTGKAISSNTDEYWLLELGPAIALDNPVISIPGDHFRTAMRLARFNQLIDRTRNGAPLIFSDIPDHYRELLHPVLP